MSCSAFGKRVIHEHGLIKGLKLLQERFHQCNAARLILYENNRNDNFEVRGCKLTGIKGCRIPHSSNCRFRNCHGSSGGNSDDCTSGGKDNTDCVSKGYNIDYLPEGCDVTLFDSCWWF